MRGLWVVSVLLVVGLAHAVCPEFDVVPYQVPICEAISDHRLCISAALNTFDESCGQIRKHSESDGGVLPAKNEDFPVSCQMRASAIRVHVLFHGKNSSLGDGGDCQRARVAFLNDTCSHFSTCAAEACVLAGLPPTAPVKTQHHSEKKTTTTVTAIKPATPRGPSIVLKDVAKMLMPRSDLRRFADHLSLPSPDAFWVARDAAAFKDSELVPVDEDVNAELELEMTKEAIRHTNAHSNNNIHH